jgi:hypothetical protein
MIRRTFTLIGDITGIELRGFLEAFADIAGIVLLVVRRDLDLSDAFLELSEQE